MAYSAWSVVFGEQPSAAKWNLLGSNDDDFNTKLGYRAYCFSGNATATSSLTSASAYTMVVGTENFDYNNNFASNTYTAPINAVYGFTVSVYAAQANMADLRAMYRIDGGSDVQMAHIEGTGFIQACGSVRIYLTAGQTVEPRVQATTSSGNWSYSATSYFDGSFIHAA